VQTIIRILKDLHLMDYKFLILAPLMAMGLMALAHIWAGRTLFRRMRFFMYGRIILKQKT
jgi:hypothetical protein